MIGWICFVLIGIGVFFGGVIGNTSAISQSILETPKECITLVIDIGGPLCLFSGLMNVARKAGLVDRFSRFLSAPIGFLIPKTKTDGALRSAVAMNLSSNFFGLGNAATPFGIEAAGRMHQEKMSRSLATFLILNTCSVQWIPTTVCALRRAFGAENPFDILPQVWLVQILSCTAGIVLVRLFFREDS